MYRYIKSSTVKASKGSCMDMLNAFRKKEQELEAATSIMGEDEEETEFYGNMTQEQVEKLNELKGPENPGPEYQYQIQESFGAPQAGCTFFNFEEWYELEEFLDEFPVVQEDIENGYATIVEL